MKGEKEGKSRVERTSECSSEEFSARLMRSLTFLTAYQKSVLSGGMAHLSYPDHAQLLVGTAWGKWGLGRNAAVHSEDIASRAVS